MKIRILSLVAILLCAHAYGQHSASPNTPMLNLYQGVPGTIGLATSGTDSHGNAILGVGILSGSTGGGGSGGAVTVTSGTVALTGTQEAVNGSTVTTSGSVAAGAHYVGLIFSPDFTGTVLGMTYSGAVDAAQPFRASPGNTLPAITYTVSAGNIRIVKDQ